MGSQGSNGWEPDASRMGNWVSLFETQKAPLAPAPEPAAPVQSEADESEELTQFDMTEYRPWVLQRVRRAPAMLNLRRYEPKADRWIGWIIPYFGLYAIEYLGGEALTLDFGARQFLVEGTGLAELARRMQDGTVLAIQEYAPSLWPGYSAGPVVRTLRKLGAPPGATS